VSVDVGVAKSGKAVADDRRSRFHRVLSHVRLPLLSPYFLHDCVENLK
jgi:hypothetical protein